MHVYMPHARDDAAGKHDLQRREGLFSTHYCGDVGLSAPRRWAVVWSATHHSLMREDASVSAGASAVVLSKGQRWSHSADWLGNCAMGAPGIGTALCKDGDTGALRRARRRADRASDDRETRPRDKALGQGRISLRILIGPAQSVRQRAPVAPACKRAHGEHSLCRRRPAHLRDSSIVVSNLSETFRAFRRGAYGEYEGDVGESAPRKRQEKKRAQAHSTRTRDQESDIREQRFPFTMLTCL